MGIHHSCQIENILSTYQILLITVSDSVRRETDEVAHEEDDDYAPGAAGHTGALIQRTPDQ